MRETELLGRLLNDLSPLEGEERDYVLAVLAGAFRHPCVQWQAERNSGLPVLSTSFPEVAHPLAGTEYRSKNFVHASGTGEEGGAFAVAVVECPHVAACALAPICPREHYGVYAELFGLGEYGPVRPRDLYRAIPPPSEWAGSDAAGVAPGDEDQAPNRGGVWNVAKAAWRSMQKTDPR
jgi:hypothetical protein